jgi:hypothetical protein
MDNRYMPSMLIAALALLPSYAAAQQFGGDCSSICAQVESFARQTRGDYAFVVELQRLSNACQKCQMGSSWGPSPSAPPQAPPRLESAPQQSTIGSYLFNFLSDLGSHWRGPTLNRDQYLSSDVQKRSFKATPEASAALEKMLSDPYAEKSAMVKPPSQRSFDGTNLIGGSRSQGLPPV